MNDLDKSAVYAMIERGSPCLWLVKIVSGKEQWSGNSADAMHFPTINQAAAEIERLRGCGQDVFGWTATEHMDMDGSNVLEAFLTALNLARDTKQEPSVPDGWKLVPLSPTKEMIDAIHNGWKDAQPDGEYDGEKTTSMYAMHVAAYKAGVKAAPVYMKLIHRDQPAEAEHE